MKKSILATLPVAAFVAGLAVVPSVFADSPSTIASWDELTECLTSSNETTCTLGDYTGQAGATITINGAKTLNLSGKTIEGVNKTTLFELDNATSRTSLTIENGTINANSEGTAIRLKGTNSGAAAGSSHLTIAQNATITNGAIVISSNGGSTNYGSLVDIYGTLNGDKAPWMIQVNGQIANPENAPVVNIHDGAVVNGGHSGGLYLAGNGTTNIDKATVSGPSGIIIKAGELNLNGAEIKGTGPYVESDASNKGAGSTGAGIQIESYDPPYVGEITLNIANSTVSSDNGYAMQEYGTGKNPTQALKAVNLSGDVTLTSAEGKVAFYVNPNVGANVDDYVVTIDGAEVPKTTLTQATGTFTTVEAPVAPEETPENPNTADPVALYVTIAAVALVGLGATVVVAKKSRR